MRQVLEFAPKKLPRQERSRATFEAIVEACTGLLPELGYARTTTNHIAERAGVNIASLYEYFPGKDAIIAQVAERLVERVMLRLAAGAERILRGDEREAMRCWIELIFQTIADERRLVSVFVYEVPYTNRLAPIRAIGERLIELSRALRTAAGGFVGESFNDATLHLVINLVSSTILQLVLEPPKDVSRRELLDELSLRVEAWIRA